MITYYIMSEEEKLIKLRKAFEEILGILELGYPSDENLERTPERMAEFYWNSFTGVKGTPPKVSSFKNPSKESDMVIVKGIPFYSFCAHHLLPFFGEASIGYIPDKKIAGFSSIGRVLSYYSKMPQLQEQLSEQIAEKLNKELSPKGIIVMLEARQLCMEMQGVKKTGKIETTATKGCFTKQEIKEEFFRRIFKKSG